MAKRKAAKRSPARTSGGLAHEHNAFIMILGGGFIVVLLILYFMGRQNSFFPSFGNKDTMFKDDAMMSDVTIPKEHSVSIENYTFAEAEVVVKVGETVTWTNNDDVAHSATADDGSFDTGLIESGQTGSVTFDTPGTYTYHCTPHPNMIGTIVVEE